MENTDKLNLPYILPSQAQKHVTHNEALRRLDAIIHLSVKSRSIAQPPVNPEAGNSYLIAVSATGEWENHDEEIACYVDGFWQFHSPVTGWRLWIEDESAFEIYDGSQWKSVIDGSTLDNVQGLGVGTSSDATNRLAVVADATLLSHNGAGHQLKLNKNTIADTASILFQTNYGGRAEFGTTGDDDWHVKTSSDGLSWNEAMVAGADSGAISFPSGTCGEMHVDAVDEAGANSWVLGPPNMKTVSYQRANLSLVKDRVYFSAFYVDRPTELLGGVFAQHIASSTSGAVVRGGVYRLGAPNANNWNVGDLVADFGSLPADVAGHKDFTLGQGIALEKGWFLAAIGTNGAAVQARFMRWMTPGLFNYVKSGSGSNADIRPSGPASYLFQNGRSSEIANGLPSVWSTNPVYDYQSTIHTVYQFLVPKWTRW